MMAAAGRSARKGIMAGGRLDPRYGVLLSSNRCGRLLELGRPRPSSLADSSANKRVENEQPSYDYLH
jgi:hypothetical protein